MWLARESEVAQGARFVDALEAGPAALVLAGEAGIGKTTLWQAVVEAARARGVRVLVCRGVEAEAKLALTALTDLLGDACDELPRLPPPQRSALEAALLLERSTLAGGDRRALATAVLAILRERARSSPVLVAVDDVQWIDRSSTRVLEFVAHRLGRSRAGFLLALRTPSVMPFQLERALGEERVQRLALARLGLPALRRILFERLGRPLPRPVAARIGKISDGNPFFALELASAWVRAGASDASEVPLPERLTGLVAARIRALPPATRRALLAAAASPRLMAALVAQGAPSGHARAALSRARRNGVVEGARDAIHFTHPLFAAAVYADASPEERRRMHHRLASVAKDPEERGRHLALAAQGPDETLARRLDAAARRAFARGAPDAAADLVCHARRLTPPARVAAARRRAMMEAEYHFAAGDPGLALELLERLLSGGVQGTFRAEVCWRLAKAHRFQDGYRTAARILREVASDPDLPDVLRAAVERDLALDFIVCGAMAEGLPHARAAVAVAKRTRDRALQSEAAATLASVRFLLGHGFSRALAKRIPLAGRVSDSLPSDRRPNVLMAKLLQWTDEFDASRARYQIEYRRALERGAEAELPTLLSCLSELECWSGRFELAERYAGEALEAAAVSGNRSATAFALYARAMPEACMGRVESARADLERGLALASGGKAREAFSLATNLHTAGFLALSLGDAAAADRPLAQLAELVMAAGLRELAPIRFAADAVEACVAIGALPRALALADWFEERAVALGRPYGLATSARARALLFAAHGDVEAALAALERALAHHAQLPMPLERGRTLLVKGRVLRRSKQKRAAAQVLGEAVGIFETLGAPLWAARAKQELARVGLRPRATLGLTAVEARVAELAAAGLGTREVAAQVFLAPKSVEGVLGRVYAKLGVHSRAALANAVAARREAAPS
jgi:DNA-binding CsgD family transcriptional regulator